MLRRAFIGAEKKDDVIERPNVGVSRAAGRRREQESGGKERPEKVAPRLGLR